jgi:hypothetical protein
MERPNTHKPNASVHYGAGGLMAIAQLAPIAATIDMMVNSAIAPLTP